MQTAFYETVFYLNKQPHSHKLQTKMRSGLFSIHFTSQGEYANIMRGGGENEYEKGEIGLKTAWGEMLTMRQRWEEGGGQREESRGRFSAKKTGWEEVITMSWMPPCPQIPNGEEREKPLQYPPHHHHHHHLHQHHHSNSQRTAPLVQYSFEHVKYH